MGQSQSQEKASSSRAATPHTDRETERQRKVKRRISVQAIQKGHSQPDALESTVAARGTTTHLDMTNLEKMLQSTSPEFSSKSSQPSQPSQSSQSSRVERSTSRKKDVGPRIIQMELPEEFPIPGPPAAPVSGIDIPTSSVLPTRSRREELEDNNRYEDRTYIPVSHNRPPRLPLPIAEVPDSPSLGPVIKNDGDSDVPIFDDDGVLPKRNSMLSVATQDEEDVGEELQPFGVAPPGETIPYTIEWNRPAKQVFVTGTFAAWDKKYRLKKSDSERGRFTTVINLPAGTHHLKFFVDNQMVTSPDLPTAVDFNNILVNYIEISTDDFPRQRRESGQIHHKIPHQIQASSATGQDTQDHADLYSGTVTPGEEGNSTPSSADTGTPIEMPEGDFRQIIPPALLDIDNKSEDSHEWQQAQQILRDLSAPPSLPLFLSRSILNASASLPVKDDASVLALPNHTVLNHLMTSNVRNGVLATSVTTRYKKKYITTMSFKPVPKPLPMPQS